MSKYLVVLKTICIEIYSWFTMVCSSLLYSQVTQVHTYRHPFFCCCFYLIFHYGLSHDIEYSCLSDTVGPCCLSILYSLPAHPKFSMVFLPNRALLAITRLFSASVSLFLFCRGDRLCHILEPTCMWHCTISLSLIYFTQYDDNL